jgi:hypothetical protein
MNAMIDRRDVLKLAAALTAPPALVPGDDPEVTNENWTEDVRKNFSGRIIVAKDLMELALPV